MGPDVIPGEAHSAHQREGQGNEHGHEHRHEAIDYARTNREHFDKIAHIYDERPYVTELIAAISRAFLKEYDFNKDTTHVLDFACGPGLLSRALAPHSKQIIGVDISQGMVDQYNLHVPNQGVHAEEMRAVRAELKGEEGELDGQKFDVVVDIEKITRILTYFLKPGGVLLVADFSKGAPQTLMEQHMDEAAWKRVVPHKGGFDEAALRTVFEKAGLEGFMFIPSLHIQMDDKEANGFVAKAVKPVD